MNDTVTKLLELVSEYAEYYAEDRKWGSMKPKPRSSCQDWMVPVNGMGDWGYPHEVNCI